MVTRYGQAHGGHARGQGINDGQWHHVVGTVDSDGMKLFVDGSGSARDQTFTAQCASRVTGGPRRQHPGFAEPADRPRARRPPGRGRHVPDGAAVSTVQSTTHVTGSSRPGSDGAGRPLRRPCSRPSPDIFWRLGESSGPVAVDSPAGTPAARSPATAPTDARASGPDDRHRRDFQRQQRQRGRPALGSAHAVHARRSGSRPPRPGRQADRLRQRGDRPERSYDRQVYMLNDGRLTFGVYNGTQQTITNPASYNDGKWHHVVATQGADGMKLYVDGTGRHQPDHDRAGLHRLLAGRWRPRARGTTSNYFAGSLDEAAVYPRCSRPPGRRITIAGGGALANRRRRRPSPDRRRNLTVTSTPRLDRPRRHVASYAWDFGDGTTGTGATPSHTTPPPAPTPVSLTVTDNGGATAVSTIRHCGRATTRRPPPSPQRPHRADGVDGRAGHRRPRRHGRLLRLGLR